MVWEQLMALSRRFVFAGSQVHDANIVATMLAHGLDRLLTFNSADFRRFAGVIELVPPPSCGMNNAPRRRSLRNAMRGAIGSLPCTSVELSKSRLATRHGRGSTAVRPVSNPGEPDEIYAADLP